MTSTKKLTLLPLGCGLVVQISPLPTSLKPSPLHRADIPADESRSDLFGRSGWKIRRGAGDLPEDHRPNEVSVTGVVLEYERRIIHAHRENVRHGCVPEDLAGHR